MEYHSGGSLPLLGRPRYCPGTSANGGYLCETGHCCGESGCCTYYYELWWFWLLWTVLILFSCCCAYRHRRAKLRVQQQQRQRDIGLLAYRGARSYPSSMLDLSFLASLKLPSYDEVAAQPSTPPPPYSSVFTTPRYPQPPRAADPHLLTHHGPLLHRPLSDGPSSLSSDNSSSCSCDSCCPSSPCSSSLSAPVTYETDTSHNSTPNEAAALTRDVTLETIAAAASRLELDKAPPPPRTTTPTVSVDMTTAGGQEAAIPSSVDWSQNPAVSRESEKTLSPVLQQLDLAPGTPQISTCSSGTSPSPTGAGPFIQSPTTGSCTTVLKPSSASEDPLASGSSTPADNFPQVPNLTWSFEPASGTTHDVRSPASRPAPESGTAFPLIPASLGLSTSGSISSAILVPDSPNHIKTSNPGSTEDIRTPKPAKTTPTPEVPVLKPGHHNQITDTFPTHICQVPEPLPHVPGPFQTSTPTVLKPVGTDLSEAPDPEQRNHIQAVEPFQMNHCQSLDPITTNLTLVLSSSPDVSLVPDLLSNPTGVPTPTHSSLTVVPATASSTFALVHCQDSGLFSQSGMTVGPLSPVSGPPPRPDGGGVLSSLIDPAPTPGPSVVEPRSSQLNPVSQLPFGSQSGFPAGSGPHRSFGSLGLASPAPATSTCPSITVDLDPSLSPQSPLAEPSPSPASVLSSAVVSSTALLGPGLLLDPLTALHQSEQGGLSSGHGSSLSPSPRSTQSPPKQTLFSPCVDVIEPGPPSWEEDGEEDQEEEVDHVDDEDEDMGADESQYRHRRLTGDSGIEVCRCRVAEEDEDKMEVRKEEVRLEVKSGGEEEEKRAGDVTSYHDSVDCPARGHLTPTRGPVTSEEDLAPCHPIPTAPPDSDDGEEAVVAMETV